MTMDYNGGTYEVVIFKQGKRFDVNNLPYFFNSISSVRAKVTSKQTSDISVTIEPSFEDALKILSSGLLGVGASKRDQFPAPQQGGLSQGGLSSLKAKVAENISNKASTRASSILSGTAENSSKEDLSETVTPFIAVRFLYPGKTDTDGGPAETGWLTGPLNVPDLSIGNGDISITLTASGTGKHLSLLEGTIVFDKVTLIEAITELVKPVGIEIDIRGAETQKILETAKVTGVFNEPRMQIIRNILFRNNCYFTFENTGEKQPVSSILITSISEMTKSPPEFSFVQFRQIDPSRNIVPIYNLELVGQSSLFVNGAVFGSFQRGVDDSKKEIKEVAVGPRDLTDNQALTGNESTGGTLPKSSKEFGGAPGIVDDSDPEMTGRSIPVYSRGGSETNEKDIKEETKQSHFNGIEYQLALPGLPRLKVHTICQVIVGDFIPGLSSAGWVHEVEHECGSEGWITNCKFVQTHAVIDKSKVTGFSNKAIEDLAKAKPAGNVKIPTQIA